VIESNRLPIAQNRLDERLELGARIHRSVRGHPDRPAIVGEPEERRARTRRERRDARQPSTGLVLLLSGGQRVAENLESTTTIEHRSLRPLLERLHRQGELARGKTRGQPLVLVKIPPRAQELKRGNGIVTVANGDEEHGGGAGPLCSGDDRRRQLVARGYLDLGDVGRFEQRALEFGRERG
jgi:hypothetical protein